MAELRVAVLGDSAVWGQGLPRDAKFAIVAAREIAERDAREGVVIEPFSARSGAKIVADEDDGAVRVGLPSGAVVTVTPGDRVDFYDVYPSLFSTDEEAGDFLAGTNEEPAFELFADIPASFPTVTYQLQRVTDAVGRDIELVIIDGSINDIDIAEGARPGVFESRRARRAHPQVRLRRVLAAARSARDKFPGAVIVATGYFSPFSVDSDRDELEALAKYLSRQPGWLLAANDVLTSSWGSILLFPLSLLGEDVGAAVEKVIRRSEFAHRRGLFWLRRAVADLNETAMARPGLIFAHPGFRPDNSAFASGTAFLHEGYKPPGADDHEVRDAVLDQRLQAIPRRSSPGGPAPRSRPSDRAGRRRRRHLDIERALRALADLRSALDGPRSVRARLNAVVTAAGAPRAACARPRRSRASRRRSAGSRSARSRRSSIPTRPVPAATPT